MKLNLIINLKSYEIEIPENHSVVCREEIVDGDKLFAPGVFRLGPERYWIPANLATIGKNSQEFYFVIRQTA